MSVFTVDGRSFNVSVSSLQRKASILDGENAGRMLSGRMERDIIGTYYNYTLGIDPKLMTPAEYDALYELLTAPVDSHALVVPYGQGTISFAAYISNAEDTLKRLAGTNLWSDLKVNFIAMEPKRR